MVQRSSLVGDLSRSRASVVLVQAPAGFGKSTVLEQWAREDDRPVAWVSLDPSEDDVSVFWRHIYAAVRLCFPDFAPQVLVELAKPGPDLTGLVIPEILNELAAIDDHLVLVLDDYHRLHSPEVDSTIQLFIRHLPQGTTLAIGTRSQPDIELARLRSQGLVHDVDASNLSLTIDETRRVVRDQNPNRTDEEIAWIHETTEGWPAGIYLYGRLEEIDRSARTTSHIRDLSLIHISEPTRLGMLSRMPSSA